MHTEPGVVFYVDDNPKSRRLLTSILLESGFQVITSDDPVEALGLCKNISFDVALLDYQMPLHDRNSTGPRDQIPDARCSRRTPLRSHESPPCRLSIRGCSFRMRDYPRRPPRQTEDSGAYKGSFRGDSETADLLVRLDLSRAVKCSGDDGRRRLGWQNRV